MDINELKERLKVISEDMKSPDFNKDIRENSTREALLAEYERLTSLITEYENDLNTLDKEFPAGTILYNMEFQLEFKEVVVGNNYLDLPPILKCMIVKNDNVNSLSELWEDKLIKISDKTLIAKNLLGKLQGMFIINTNKGYVKLEVTY